MKSFREFKENFGGLPTMPVDYSKTARPANAQHTDLGQVHLTLLGNALHIDAANHSVRLSLTPQQVQQIMSELS